MNFYHTVSYPAGPGLLDLPAERSVSAASRVAIRFRRYRHELDKAAVIRTAGAGCIFLFEEWALHRKEIVGSVMPGDPEIMRSIFRGAHSYLLAIRTPCSGDFSAEAQFVSAMTSPELRWVDVGLENLEANLAATLKQSGDTVR